jgi:RNA polymerase sigma-70 factor, ECF subfamily
VTAKLAAPRRTAVSDDDADSQLVRQLYGSWRRLAGVAGFPNLDPDDLLQEAIARTLRLGPLSRLENPNGYVRAAIVRLASNQRRAFAIRRRISPRLRADAANKPTSYPSDLSDLLHVSAATRTVLFLVDIEGCPYAEAAQALGCSEEAARARAMRGRRALRERLEEES